jgi:HSP20 family protein
MARQTSNQQTSQGTSHDQQYTAGDRQQGTRTQQQGTSGAPATGAQAQPQPATTGGRGDSERSLQSTREGGTGRGSATAGRSSGTGMTRGQGYSPTWGRAAANDPFALMQRMAEDMDRLFDQFGLGRTGFGLVPSTGSLLGRDARGAGSLLGQGASSLWSPQVEVLRRGDEIVVRADVPGVNRDDLQVSVEDDVLTIRGERRDAREESGEGLYRSERSYGEFFRAISLPEGTDAERCEAKYEDGVLEVTLPMPKQEERKPRRIEVR